MRSRGQLGVSQIDRAWICVRAPNVLCVLAVLATVAVPLGFAPSALAAETGQIAGEVTNASTGARVSGIQVCANVIGECDATEGAGKYVIPNVAPGTYTLHFYSRDPLTLNYISREIPGVVVAPRETREVDAALLKGPEEVHELETRMSEDLNEYCQFAADLGMHPELRAGLAPDVVVELRRLCLEVAHEFPHVVFFAGKLIFSDEIEGFIGRFLHNHTSVEIQNWLQLYGYSLVILPIRVGAGSMAIPATSQAA